MSYVRTILLGMSLVMPAWLDAMAEATTLVCGDLPFTLIVDQTGGTVTMNTPARQLGSIPVSPRSDTYPATFDGNEINFTIPGGTNPTHYKIDRITAMATASTGGALQNYQCHVGKRQF